MADSLATDGMLDIKAMHGVEFLDSQHLKSISI